MTDPGRFDLSKTLRAAWLLPGVMSYRKVADSYDDVDGVELQPAAIGSWAPRFPSARTLGPDDSGWYDGMVRTPIPQRQIRAVKIPHGRVVSSAGIVTADGTLVKESLWDQEHFERDFSRPRRVTPPHRVEGRAACLVSLWDRNYYHFMVDVLSRFAVLESLGLDRETRFIVPDPLASYQREMLERVGIGSDRLVPFRNAHVQAEELIWTTPAAYISFITPFMVDWIRTRLGGTARTTGERRLYIRRTGSRNIVNDHEVSRILERYGFEPVSAERMTVEDQIRLFSQARFLVATHGAGLTNAVFADQLSVLEMYQPGFIQPVYFALAGAAGYDYWYLQCRSESAKGDTKAQGIVVPLELFEQSLRAMLS